MTDLAFNIIDFSLSNGAVNALFVGGCVRDKLLNIPSKDVDIEVYGLSLDKLQEVLSARFDVKAVGESFGVLKINNLVDVSIPRRESKSGSGHKGFDIIADCNMSIEEAASRRDFTINSMMMDRNGKIFDPFNGKADLDNRILRATSPAFVEDPLRVLRGMQFAARFDMSMEPVTIEMCKKLVNEFQFLAKERIFEEWWKWATKSIKPSRGLDLLRKTGWIIHFPEIEILYSCPQQAEWHPEGDVGAHTEFSCDAAAEVAIRENLSEEDRAILLFSSLCHDFGKPATTVLNDAGKLTCPAHDDAGVVPTLLFLERIGAYGKLLEHCPVLVKEHMVRTEGKPSARVVRRLSNRLVPSNIKMWSYVCEADHSGRPPIEKGNPVKDFLDVATEIVVLDDRPKPILMGRHLLDLGWKPGPAMGEVLKDAFEKQLDGEFSDLENALKWVQKENYANRT